MTLRAVFFDLDDTLIDWSGFNEDWSLIERRHIQPVFEYFIREGHLAPIELDIYLKAYRNNVMNAWADSRQTLKAVHVGDLLIETATALGAAPETIAMERMFEVYGWGIVPGTVAFPEVPTVLQHLIENGLQIGIVTNAPQPMALRDRELAGHGLFDYFPACRISAADAGYLKPHPAIFQLALDTLGVEPDEAVFVGDDLDADIVGARKMGIRAVLRVTRHTVNSPRRDVQPDARVNSLTELPAILDTWFPGWRASQGPNEN